jgi:hypothetical protein
MTTNLAPCFEVVLLVDMFVVGRVQPDLVNLHQRINCARKARQRVSLKNNLQALAVKFMWKVEPISGNGFQISGGNIACENKLEHNLAIFNMILRSKLWK